MVATHARFLSFNSSNPSWHRIYSAQYHITGSKHLSLCAADKVEHVSASPRRVFASMASPFAPGGAGDAGTDEPPRIVEQERRETPGKWTVIVGEYSGTPPAAPPPAPLPPPPIHASGKPALYMGPAPSDATALYRLRFYAVPRPLLALPRCNPGRRCGDDITPGIISVGIGLRDGELHSGSRRAVAAVRIPGNGWVQTALSGTRHRHMGSRIEAVSMAGPIVR